MSSVAPTSLPSHVLACVNEKTRLDALAALDVMNTHADEDFGRLTRVAAAVFGVPSSAIAVVDSTRSSLVSAHGTQIREVALENSIAAHAIAASDGLLIVPDCSVDSRFRHSGLVTGEPSIRFYVGATVRVNGQPLGALQVFDIAPGTHPPDNRLDQLRDLAATVGRLFELKEEARVRERTAAELIREEWRHALTLEAGRVGSWVWNIRTKEVVGNDILRRMYGLPAVGPITSDDLSQATNPADRPAVDAAIERSMRDGVDYQTEYRVAESGRWLVARGRVYQRDVDGAPLTMMGVNIDITEAREAADRTRLLLRELNHRVKNTLAMIQSLARQTMRRNPDPESFLGTFTARLRTLSDAHSLLSDRDWAWIGLSELVAARVSPYADDPQQVRVVGDDVKLPADHALALGLVLHEMAVNAARFGALSTLDGRLEISWTRNAEGRVDFHWREMGGPPVGTNERGLGTNLIERGMDKIVGSVVRYELRSGGAEATISMPVPEI